MIGKFVGYSADFSSEAWRIGDNLYLVDTEEQTTEYGEVLWEIVSKDTSIEEGEWLVLFSGSLDECLNDITYEAVEPMERLREKRISIGLI